MAILYKKKTKDTREIYFLGLKIFSYSRNKERIKNDLKIQRSLELASRSRNETGISDTGNKLIVSLTSYGTRLESAYITIESIFQQKLKPQKVILWVAEDEINSMDELPKELREAQKWGLEVRFCKDTRSYKKLVYTLPEFPDNNIITIDDDVMYPPYFLERLNKYSQKYPEAIICYRARKISFDESGELLPYLQWKRLTSTPTPGRNIIPTGVGGILYPPNSLHTDTTNENLFTEFCPSTDDIWFKAMSLRLDTLCFVVPDSEEISDIPPTITETQEQALEHNNLASGNDSQFKAVFNHYNLWEKLDQEPCIKK